MIDWAVLDQLMKQIDDDTGGLLADLIESYLADSSIDVRRLVVAADAGDATWVLKMTHALRSTSDLLGATTLVGLLQQAEDSARNDPVALPTAARHVEEEYARVSTALQELRPGELLAAGGA